MGAWQSYHSPDKHFSNSFSYLNDDKSYCFILFMAKLNIYKRKYMYYFSFYLYLYAQITKFIK